MGETADRLKSIAMEYLYEGMKISDDIYNYNGKVLLLASGTVLTAGKLEQLKNFNGSYRNISVTDLTYRTLMERGIALPNKLAQEYLEQETGYTAIKEKTGNLLNEIQNTNSISRDDAGSIADEISERLRSIDPSLIFQCINAPNPIDEYLRRHSVNVALINGFMGRWLNLPEKYINLLVLSGLAHDVGKTKIPAEILNAPRKLTFSEFEIMKMHPVYSYDLLGTDRRFPEPVRAAARHHHEKMNGSGYPDGLSTDTIPLFAKITAVSDIYDAMVSKRSYKEANDPFLVISKLSTKQFSELDMTLIKVFTERMPRELVEKPVLLSDGSIGTIKYVIPDDLEHPLVDVNGIIVKMDKNLSCVSMISEE